MFGFLSTVVPSYPPGTEYKFLSLGNKVVVFPLLEQPRKLGKESEAEILSICSVDGWS